MIRLGIIGSENSHADAFAQYFTNEELYPDIKAVGIAGDYPESNERIGKQFGLKIYENYLDMLGEVDAVAVTSRDGSTHARFARPFIEAGLPVFVDKPFCSDGDEAKELLALAKEKNVPVFGGSSLKLVTDVRLLASAAQVHFDKISTAMLSAPLNMNNQWGGFYFYSAHLVEMCLTVFGYDPIEVTAVRGGDSVIAIVKYANFNVSLHFVQGCGHYYGQFFFGVEKYAKDVDISFFLEDECKAFAETLRTGKMPFSYDQLAKPAYFLNAVYESYTTGKTVKIKNANL